VNAQTDQQLLQDYAARHSEAAFAELVRRHIDLVYSAARRMVCDSHQAEDVTQAVFVALAQNARQLTHHPVLSGWLHRTTQNLASNAVRTNVRRQTREQEAAAMNELLSAGSDASWEHIAPHLDAALGELSEPDRDAVLLRYFEKKSAQEMAERLGITDEAAQKRVNRAVERLRGFFAKRGVTVGAGGLVLISANAVQAAPIGLAVTISTVAAVAGTTIVTTATTAATKAIAMTILQKTVVIATVAVLAGVGIHKARQVSQLREQVQSLQQQQAPLLEQLQQVQQQRDDATQQLTGIRTDNERLNRSTAELVKLRAQVASYLAQDRSPARTTQAPTPEPLKWVAMDTNQFAPLSSDRTPEVLGYPQILQDSAAANYTRVTNALGNAKTTHDRYLALSEAAKLAFVFGDTEDARKYANEVLALDKGFRAPSGGDATFSGNLVLGRIALREGQTEDAKRYLLEAGLTPGSPVLNSFGPNMTLARDLLRAGEQDTVLQYFELCRKFWGSSGEDKLARWARDVQAGNMPDFGGNIYF
jgi:RNA polymerase sigma factor (sigma-70 family)